MQTYYLFQSGSAPDLRCFTDEASGSKLPAEDGPWALVRKIDPEDEMPHDVSRKIVAVAVRENGFFLAGESNLEKVISSKTIIESDRVEGTTVVDRNGDQIGTIKRLLIEKVSGHVVFVDVSFGGFFGIGAHHHTIPWDKLAYDRALGGYRTEITEAEVRGAPSLAGEGEIWHDRKGEEQVRRYWSDLPKKPI